MNKASAQGGKAPASAPTSAAVANFDLFFLVRSGATGTILANTPYKITLEDGREVLGVNDELGHTQKVFSDFAQKATIKVPYYDDCHTDTPSQSDTCGC